jgi:hypothetical protein
MPMVHFIGEIKICKIAGNDLFFQKCISLTWAIVTGTLCNNVILKKNEQKIGFHCIHNFLNKEITTGC